MLIAFVSFLLFVLFFCTTAPLGPMRFTDAVYRDKGDYELCEAINIFSVKIGCSDVGFPIHVYGTVIARDSIDHKCVYLFRCDRDHCQIINSEAQHCGCAVWVRGNAVEGTIAIEVIQGNFDGQITAHTTSTQNTLVLYDRELYSAFTSDGKGVIQLMRPVVSVSVKDMLVIVAKTRDGKSESTISFTPRVNGGEEDVIPIGDDKMRVKVTWSIMDF
ncbi:hypothetical protein PR202_gb22313 [Eleusine coracana subsp. coracana]|uniref:DUF6598 domain-containing protein n=1 Tax=Eleusine coracana subsp. coracana TaxID=191504 RepID=A0AAV5FFD0_ELECO|nr:hypothetical protein PR202_gb22313 [Eleusine coracana subsp. coracana]